VLLFIPNAGCAFAKVIVVPALSGVTAILPKSDGHVGHRNGPKHRASSPLLLLAQLLGTLNCFGPSVTAPAE
jgi:hypothetical protein